jgi:hypothetical protein
MGLDRRLGGVRDDVTASAVIDRSIQRFIGVFP